MSRNIQLIRDLLIGRGVSLSSTSQKPKELHDATLSHTAIIYDNSAVFKGYGSLPNLDTLYKEMLIIPL